jgi:hypothetical protein
MRTIHKIQQFFIFGLVVGATSTASGDLILASTASASSEFSSGYVAENTINGSGLPAGFNETDIHSTYESGNHWTTNGSDPQEAWILWGFDSAQSLNGMFVWNHLSNNIASNAGYEPVLADLTLLDSGDNVLLFLDDFSLTPDTAGAAEFVSFGASFDNISSVLFEVEAVQSSNNFTGLAEVAFQAVPEPNSTAVLISGVFLTFIGRRRKK